MERGSIKINGGGGMTILGYREASRIFWGNEESEGLTLEQINTGAVLRIADATEKMAQRHTELIRDRDYYKGKAERLDVECNRLSRRVAALRGVITRMKTISKLPAPNV